MKVRVALLVALVVCMQSAVAAPLNGSAPARVAGSRTRQDDLTGPDLKLQLLPGQSATPMQDGRWLLIGGSSQGVVLDSAELWDPRTETAERLGSKLSESRSGHTATILPNGQVLVLGGVRGDGSFASTAEIYDPIRHSFRVVGISGFDGRTQHSATLMTDGRVLVAGGLLADGTLTNSILFIESSTRQVSASFSGLVSSRRGHTAQLLADGNVLIWGGRGSDGGSIEDGETFDAVTGLVRRTDARPLKEPGESRVAMSSPEDGATDVRVDSALVIRFSRNVLPQSIGAETVRLYADDTVVRCSVVSCESGMLLFVTPFRKLATGTHYRLVLDGISDGRLSITPVEIGFYTEGPAHPDANTADNNPEWIPDEHNLDGDWTSGRSKPSVDSAPDLLAPDGVTAVSGRVRRLDGRGLANVEIRVGGVVAKTDESGRFLVVEPAIGQQELMVHGHPASTATETFGMFEIELFVREGRTNVLPYTIWMPVIDTASATRLEPNSVKQIVATTSRMPGLEVHIPSHSILRVPPAHDLDHGGVGSAHSVAHASKSGGQLGKPLDALSITALPLDRTPFPAPAGLYMLFTFQSHGAVLERGVESDETGIRIIYPNYPGLPPGTRVSLWSHDSTVGWYVYGEGEVSDDGQQIIPDPGVVLNRLNCGQAFGSLSGAPMRGPRMIGPNGDDGDPVDLSTGLFVYKKVDISIPDVIPIVLMRTYRQNDAVDRSFGKGASEPYDMFLVADSTEFYAATFVDLVLPDGGRLRFDRTTPIGSADEFLHVASPSPFYKSTIKAGGVGWQIRMREGTVLQFKIYHLGAPRLESITDRYGNQLRVIRNQADGAHEITRIVSPNGRWIDFSYNASGLIASITDNIGRAVSYEYDTQNRLKKATNQSGGFAEYTYDSSHRMLTLKDPRGIVYLTNAYDSGGRVAQQTQADQSAYTFAYSLDPNTQDITQADVTNPRGFVHRATYNYVGALTSESYAVGTSVEQTYQIERDASNFMMSTTDPLGRIAEYGYDTLGNTTSITTLAATPEALTSSYTYEPAFNQPASLTDTLGRVTSVTYDTLGSPLSITEPGELPVTFQFDSAGAPQAATHGSTTAQFQYLAGEQVSTQLSAGIGGSRVVDAVGRTVQAVDALGHVTRYQYGPMNRLTSVTDPQGGQTQFGYDLNGNLVSVQDARGNVTSYVIDNMNRIATRTDSSGVSETFNYDGQGNLLSHQDRRGINTTYAYDALDRVSTVTVGGDGGTIGFQFDAGNRLVHVNDSASGAITLGYDSRGRVLSETSARGTVSYTYDDAGRRLTMQAPGQPVVNYGYNTADRVTAISQGSRSATFEYDAQMRRSAMNISGGVRVEYAYDEASRTVGISYSRDGVLLGDLTYDYDSGSRLVATGGTFARTTLPTGIANTTVASGNRLTSLDSQTLTYDYNGNLTNDGSLTYTWNSRNQLAAISGPGLSATFSYDALGRRIARTVNGSTTEFVLDGDSVVREIKDSSEITDFLIGPGVDETLILYGSGGDRTILADALGSTVTSLSTGAGAQTEFTYGPFGETTVTGGPDLACPQYAGRENDGTGLYYYRARYYNPRLQRFISEDLIGFAGGTPNLYEYVGNAPTLRRDPSGLIPLDTIFDVLCIVYDVYVLATDSEKNSATNWTALGADVAGVLIPYGTGFGMAVRARRVLEVGKGGEELIVHGAPRFIAGRRAGEVVDTIATPPGRYIQPDRSATDILQGAPHPDLGDFASRTHTHPARIDINPNDPSLGRTTLLDPRPVTSDEVLNIMSGAARPSMPRGR